MKNQQLIRMYRLSCYFILLSYPEKNRLAVNYLFLTDDGLVEHPELVVEPFNASHEQNDYEVCLRTVSCQVFSLVQDPMGPTRHHS